VISVYSVRDYLTRHYRKKIVSHRGHKVHGVKKLWMKMKIAEKVIGLAIKVHSILGPGLLESAYEKALVYELRKNGFDVSVQEMVPINYEDLTIDEGYRADIIVNKKVILELKSVRNMEDVFFRQLLTYVRLSKLKLGLIINFNETLLRNGIRRVINGQI
jgi:GxxExxY protein